MQKAKEKRKAYPSECRVPKNRKKRFLKSLPSDQCKEIEENIRVVKTRDRFKKIRDREGMFRAKMGTIKQRHGMDLTEAEYIKKRVKEYIEELHKKDINDPGKGTRDQIVNIRWIIEKAREF